MNSPTKKTKVLLTGDTALELIAPLFREAGYDVHGPDSPAPDVFAPDFIYDVTSHDADLAREVAGFRDARFMTLAGCPYSLAGLHALVDEFAWHIRRAPKKILAVDADNTLWRGILSEDGAANLVPCATFQRGLLDLRRAGVLLVLLSKNDPFEFRADLPIQRADFAAAAVDWNPKPGNLLAICRALNLGLDSAVFLDDNPRERAQMASHLPDVTVAPWNGWSADLRDADAVRREEEQLVRRLREYFFFGAGTTDEDRLRANDYAANAARLAACAAAANRDDYLEELGLWVKPARATEANLDRLAQMAAKTNQFNATTRRRTRGEFATLLDDPTKRVFVFRAGDRFGEQGVVAYAVADLETHHLTDFVMSCRAMGRTLEHFVLLFVTRELGFEPTLDFIPTARNAPFATFRKSPGNPPKTHYKEIT